MTSRKCTKCGASFFSSPTGGRPRSRCDGCRTNHDKNDGQAWRELRAQVLAEEPVCCVRGCGRPSVQVDHVIPLKMRPDLGLERSNLRGICAFHNASKGARVSPGPAVSPKALAWVCRCPTPRDDQPRHWCM